MDRSLRLISRDSIVESPIDALARTGVVFTQEIPANGWTEVDSPSDLERASTPGAAWL